MRKGAGIACVVVLVTCAVAAQAQWEMQNANTRASLRGLSVVSDQVVWASGSGGTYLRTTDGGRTWTAAKVPGAEELDFRGVKAFDADTAVLMSSGPAEQGRARIYRTSDGGKNWALAYEAKTPGVFLDAVAFWDRRHGIVVGDPAGGHFFEIVTEDGGRTWKDPALSVQKRDGQGRGTQMPAALPKEGAFAASNSCLAVSGKNNAWFVTGGAGQARVFRSLDRGRSWQVASTPLEATAASGLFSVGFRDARHGVAVGGDYRQPTASATTVVVTNDGGRSWHAASAAVAGLFLSGVAYGGAGHLVAVGSAGWAESRDGGQHWKKGGEEGFNVVAVSGKTVWAAGSAGRVARLQIAD
jgi:photosystem II stability/assembly factor-like uncharacterized protein